LVAFGPRLPGSQAAAAASDYLRGELTRLGLRVEELGRAEAEAPARVLLARIAPAPDPASEDPGGDLLVLAARYDSEPVAGHGFLGVNDGASGAALLLELARTLALDPLPYQTWLAFLEGDGHRGEAEEARLVASERLVGFLAERGELDRVRLVVYWEQVADRDLTVSRDLHSEAVSRDTFFGAAARLGLAARFPAEGAFDPIPAGHLAFWNAGVRRAVALADVRFGGDLPPGSLWHSEEDSLAACSAESLDAVLRVSELGLRENAARLRAIDAYTRRPVAPRGGDLPAPQNETTSGGVVQAGGQPADAEGGGAVAKESP
jgi:hypothetical protein